MRKLLIHLIIENNERVRKREKEKEKKKKKRKRERENKYKWPKGNEKKRVWVTDEMR